MSAKIKHRNTLRQRRARRTRAKVSGTAERPRISFFRSNKRNYVQVINDEEGRTLVSVSPSEVDAKKGATKTDMARTLGEMCAAKMKEKGIVRATFDRGAYRYHGRTKSFVEALREGGIDI